MLPEEASRGKAIGAPGRRVREPHGREERLLVCAGDTGAEPLQADEMAFYWRRWWPIRFAGNVKSRRAA
jgi:hypothetical protein